MSDEVEARLYRGFTAAQLLEWVEAKGNGPYIACQAFGHCLAPEVVHGSMVLADPRQKPESGDLVVFEEPMPDGTTRHACKRLEYWSRTGWVLKSFDGVLPLDDERILGPVVAVVPPPDWRQISPRLARQYAEESTQVRAALRERFGDVEPDDPEERALLEQNRAILREALTLGA